MTVTSAPALGTGSALVTVALPVATEELEPSLAVSVTVYVSSST